MNQALPLRGLNEPTVCLQEKALPELFEVRLVAFTASTIELYFTQKYLESVVRTNSAIEPSARITSLLQGVV